MFGDKHPFEDDRSMPIYIEETPKRIYLTDVNGKMHNIRLDIVIHVEYNRPTKEQIDTKDFSEFDKTVIISLINGDKISTECMPHDITKWLGGKHIYPYKKP